MLDWPYLQVDASSDRLELDIANAFDTPWELDDASTELLVDFSNLEVIDLWLVGIDARDKAGKVAADIRFQILPLDLVTFVDVWLTANDMDMALVSPFMPILPAVKPITEILRESLRGGIAKRFELTLAANTGPGIQELGMRTAPGVALLSSAERVEFVMPGWVGLQEGNALLSVTSERSQIWATGRVSQHYQGRCTPPATQCPSLRGDGMKIEVLTARARDFPEELQGYYPSYLKINGSVKGDFYTLTNTLGRFDALEGAEGFFIDGVFSGPIRGDLTIAFGIPAETLPPLGANAFRDVFELEVVGHLDQGSIGLPDIPIHVSNISGNFHFDLENGFWSDEIRGSFLGGDFVATLGSDTHLHDPDIISSIAIDGVLDVTHLSPWLGTVASELSQGNARWEGAMEFPLLGGTSAVEFEVTSDLAGIKFDLPEPLNKAADEQLRIDLAMVLATWEAPIDLSVLLGELQANLRIEEFDMHGRVNFGAASFDMPSHVPTQNYGGIEIFARLESGELLEWLDISKRISEIGEATPGPAKVPVRYLNANIAKGTTMGLVVEDIAIEMVADPGRDNLTINAMAPSGASVTDRVLDVHGTLPASDQEPLVGEAWMKSIDVSDIELTDRSSEFSYIDATWRIDDLRYGKLGIGANSGTAKSRDHQMVINLHRTEGQMLPAQGTLTFTLAQELEELDSLTLALEIDSWSEDFATVFDFSSPLAVSTKHLSVSGTIGTAVEKSIGNIAAWVGTIDLKAEDIDLPLQSLKQFDLPGWIDDAIIAVNTLNLGGVLLQGKSPSSTNIELLEGSIAFDRSTATIDEMTYSMPAAKGSISSLISINEDSLLQSDISLGATAIVPIFKSLPWWGALLGGTTAFGQTWLFEKIFSKQLQDTTTWALCFQSSGAGFFTVKRDLLEADPACLELEPSDAKDPEEGAEGELVEAEVLEGEK